MCRNFRFVPVLLSLVAVACGDPRPNTIQHPIHDSLSIDPEEAVRIDRRGPVPAPLRTFVAALRDHTVLASIGAMGGEPEYELGMVADALFLPEGRLAVLDRMAAAVRVFDLDGSHRYSIGGSGEGPGEFDVPLALVGVEDEQVWVIDGARAIHRFRMSEGRLEFQDRIRPEGFSRDACVSGESVVLHTPAQMPGAEQGEVLFTIDWQGETRHAFAVPYRYTHRLAGSRLKRGSITCTDRSVLLGFESQNRLDAYRSDDGALLWHATFHGIQILALVEEVRADGRRSVRADIRRWPVHHVLLRVAGGGGAPAIVQFGRRSREDVLDRIDRYTVETYVVDPATGEGAYVGDRLPEVLVVEDDLIAFLHPAPYPRVEIARLDR